MRLLRFARNIVAAFRNFKIMSLRLRRFIYLFFIILFLIAAPIMILYTAGYRYSWQKSKVEQVGVLIINVKPTDSRLYLNNAQQSDKRPLRLTDLLPNYYLVRAEKENYWPWQKNLEIKSRLSTLLYDIALFKKTLPRLFLTGKTRAFSFFAKDKKIAFVDETGVWIKKNNEELEMVFSYHPAAPTSSPLLSWSANGQFLLNSYLVIDTSNPEESLNLQLLTSLKFSDLQWSPRDNYLLYGLSGEELYKINLNQQKTEKIASQVKSFTLMNSRLYFTQVKTNGVQIVQYDSSGILNKFENITVLPNNNLKLRAGQNNYLMAIESAQNNLYLINLKDSGEPIILLKGSEAVWGEGEKNNYLAYYNAAEWWIFDPKIKKTQMMGRYSNDLRKVLPLPNIPYYVYLVGNTIYLTELDDRGERNTYALFKGREIGELWVDAEGKNIYFTDKIGGQLGLFQLEIQ